MTYVFCKDHNCFFLSVLKRNNTLNLGYILSYVWQHKDFKARAGLKPMQVHWAPRHGVWVDYSFLPDTPCAWEFSRNGI